MTILLFGALLVGCSATTDTAVVRTRVPDYLLQCGESPRLPASITEAWVIDLGRWGRECHDHLAQVRELLR